MSYTLPEFIQTYNDVERFPTLRDVAAHLGIAYKTVKNRAGELRRKGEKLVSRAAIPVSEKSYVYHEDWTPGDCIKSLKEVAEQDAEHEISRIRYRTVSGVADSTWNRHFGTFEEFKRQAGLSLTRTQQLLEKHIAKHASRDTYSVLDEERRGYEGKYLRESKNRFKTLLIASDIHDIECDEFFLRVFLSTAQRAQPDVICIAGDLFDLPEFGKYTVDPREWDVVKRINYVHNKVLKPLRETCPNSQIDLIEGNHECVSEDTKVLTDKGWVLARNLKVGTKVASYSLDGKSIDFSEPIDLKAFALTPSCSVRGKFTSENISKTHRIDLDGFLQPVRPYVGKTIQTSRKRTSLNLELPDIDMSDDEIRFFVRLLCRARRAKEGNTFYLKPVNYKDQLEIAREFDQLDLPYTFKKKFYYFNKQTKEWFLSLKTPEQAIKFSMMSERQLNVFLAAFKEFGGMLETSSYDYFYIASKVIGRQIQKSLCFHGKPTLLNRCKQGVALYSYKKIPEKDTFTVSDNGRQTVVAIQTKNGTLITCKDDIINFTGNCRLIKHLADATPALRAVLSDLHGFTISRLLGLDEYEVNYIAKADLRAWSKRDAEKELANNYKVYWDSYLVHHLPQARSMGMPGCHGHHHQHNVWSAFSPIYGTYEWHQLGCGHKRVASYCEGERWGMGFAMVSVDTATKTSAVDYVSVQDFAVSGGKYYYRNPEVERPY